MKRCFGLSAIFSLTSFLALTASLLAQPPAAQLPATEPAAAKNKFEGEIAAFEEKDKAFFPTKEQVLFVGSSTIRLWDLKESFPGMPVLNRGFGGSEMADSLYFAKRIVVPYNPRVIVLYAGDNDLASGKTPAAIRDAFQQFCRLVHRELPETRLVCLGIKPSPSRWKLIDQQRETKSLLQKVCRQEKWTTFVDLEQPLLDAAGQPRPELYQKDQLHLSAEGYKILTKLVQPAIAL